MKNNEEKSETNILLKELILEIKKLNLTLMQNNMHNFQENNNYNKENPLLFEDIYGNKCKINKITTDHIWPKSKNGSDDKDNKMKICLTSNLLKRQLTRKIKINEISFSVLAKKLTKNNVEKTVGIVKINKSLLSDEQKDFYLKNNLVKTEEAGKFFIIDTQKEQERYEEFKK